MVGGSIARCDRTPWRRQRRLVAARGHGGDDIVVALDDRIPAEDELADEIGEFRGHAFEPFQSALTRDPEQAHRNPRARYARFIDDAPDDDDAFSEHATERLAGKESHLAETDRVTRALDHGAIGSRLNVLEDEGTGVVRRRSRTRRRRQRPSARGAPGRAGFGSDSRGGR